MHCAAVSVDTKEESTSPCSVRPPGGSPLQRTRQAASTMWLTHWRWRMRTMQTGSRASRPMQSARQRSMSGSCASADALAAITSITATLAALPRSRYSEHRSNAVFVFGPFAAAAKLLMSDSLSTCFSWPEHPAAACRSWARAICGGRGEIICFSQQPTTLPTSIATRRPAPHRSKLVLGNDSCVVGAQRTVWPAQELQ